MTSQNPSTRATIALGLAIMLVAVCIFVSFTRPIHSSGASQSVSNKYEAAIYGLADGQQTTVIKTPLGLEIPHRVSFRAYIASEEPPYQSWLCFSLHVRPPPHV